MGSPGAGQDAARTCTDQCLECAEFTRESSDAGQGSFLTPDRSAVTSAIATHCASSARSRRESRQSRLLGIRQFPFQSTSTSKFSPRSPLFSALADPASGSAANGRGTREQRALERAPCTRDDGQGGRRTTRRRLDLKGEPKDNYVGCKADKTEKDESLSCAPCLVHASVVLTPASAGAKSAVPRPAAASSRRRPERW